MSRLPGLVIGAIPARDFSVKRENALSRRCGHSGVPEVLPLGLGAGSGV